MHGAADDMVQAAQSIRLAAAGAAVELELVPGATHFWNGAADVAGIVSRSIGFLRAQAFRRLTVPIHPAVGGKLLLLAGASSLHEFAVDPAWADQRKAFEAHAGYGGSGGRDADG